MSNDNQNAYERLFKLWACICKLIMDGKRDPGLVADVLQKIKDDSKRFAKSIPEMITKATIPATPKKSTRDRFKDDKRYYYRDSDLDTLLPAVQEERGETSISSLRLHQPATFKQVVEEVLKEEGDIEKLAKLLKERRHTTTLTQTEELVERQESGEDVGLVTNSYANFFFVEDKEGCVSVVVVYRDPDRGRWDVGVYRLDRGNRWGADDRFFFSNLDS